MALIPVLRFCESDDCKQLQVSDNTGKFDAADNPGGWGAPNVELANTTSATAKILLPGGVVGSEEVIVDLQPQIPNDTFGFKLLKTQDLGLGTDLLFPDGTYVVDYTVVNSVGPVTFTYHTEITLICQAGKCINDMLAKIAATGCDCDDTLIQLAIQGHTVLDALKHAATCQRPAEVTKILLLLDKICKQIDNCLLDVC